MDTKIDFIPGMVGIRLRDLPSFIRTTNAADVMLQITLERANDASKGVGLILNTFDALEPEVLAAVRKKFSNIYTVGPLAPVQHMLVAKFLKKPAIAAQILVGEEEEEGQAGQLSAELARFLSFWESFLSLDYFGYYDLYADYLGNLANMRLSN